MCLTGSVVIVLHAPPDKEIESINTMLDYAIAPGTPSFCTDMTETLKRGFSRLFVLLRSRCDFRHCNGVQDIAKVRSQESSCVPVNLLDQRIDFGDGNQSLRYRVKAHHTRGQPICSCFDICLHHCGRRMHPHAVELFQQSTGDFFDQSVRPISFQIVFGILERPPNVSLPV